MKNRDFLFTIQTKESLAIKFASVVTLFALCITLIGCAHIAPGEYPTNVDIDIDSDNNNAFDQPDQSALEDDMEDHPSKPGRIVVKNDDDNDGDQVPDFADGFNLDGIPDNADDINPSQRFVPLVLKIPHHIDLDRARIRIRYNASNPLDVEILRGEPPLYKPGPGTLRIWSRPGNLARNPAKIAEGGDFVAPTECSPAQLGLTSSNRSVTWYVEGIQASRNLADQQIVVELDADGHGSARLDKDVVRLTIIDLQFKTRGQAGQLVEQAFFYNSVPVPEIHAIVRDCQINERGLVTMTISGRVTDQTSDIVANPSMQLRNIAITPENQATYVIDLVNMGKPEYPWRPYSFESTFVSIIRLQTSDSGEYRVSLKSSQNVAGLAAELGFYVVVNGQNVFCTSAAQTSPGTYIPTILRIDAPRGTFAEGGDTISAFGKEWPLHRRDLGDGDYLYAIDQMQNVAVFLPALYGKEVHPDIPIKLIGEDVYVNVRTGAPNNKSEVGYKTIKGVIGLIVDNDDVTAEFNKIDNYTHQVFDIGGVKKHVYRPRPGWAGHTDNSLDTEIKWRYINNADTIHEFKSKNLFDKDIAYRKKVVNAVKSVTFAFGAPKFNPVFWDPVTLLVKPSKTASEAIGDIFANQTEYTMACWLGAASVILNGVSAVYPGPQGFDKSMSSNPYGNYWKAVETAIVPNYHNNNHNNNAKWMPGDWGYIDNQDPKEPKYLEGENVIYVGGCFDMDFINFKKNADFWGHGGWQKIRKLEIWMNDVEGWSKDGACPDFDPKDCMLLLQIRDRLWLQ